MRGTLVKARIKPEHREAFLQAIEHDALHSESDEPGCLRFNVLQDMQDENVYYFWEVYQDEDAAAAHRASPHYQEWAAAAWTLDGPLEVHRCTTVFPSDPAYWAKR
jgi:autoinducer 2-degrading protein